MADLPIMNKVTRYRQQIIITLSELVSIPTSNPPGQSYKECVDYLSQKLSEWKIGYQIIAVSDGDYPRFCLLGALGSGQEAIHFHGHYDVVPAFRREQFKPCLKGDQLFGRGSSDMKGGLVAMLFALRLIKENKLDLKGRITFSIVPDEETGSSLGTQYLVESGFLPKAIRGMLMPEPTSGIIWNANKGGLSLRVEVKGKSSHVGLAKKGVNAFENMVRVVNSLFKLKKDIEKRKTSMAVTPQEASRSVMLIGGQSGSGITFNLVPDKAFFTIDRRFNPEENLKQAKQEIMEVLDEQRKKGIEIDVQILQEGESSLASPEEQVARALEHSVREVTGKTPRFELCPGLCEIRFFNRHRIPAYAYGPGLLQVSHGPDEYVKISDVLKSTAIYVLAAQQV